jgi:hypothetical protein
LLSQECITFGEAAVVAVGSSLGGSQLCISEPAFPNAEEMEALVLKRGVYVATTVSTTLGYPGILRLRVVTNWQLLTDR